MLSKGIEFRKANPDQPFTDVSYKRLVSSPMEVLAGIYEERGPISSELKHCFIKNEKENAQYKFGKHEYRLEDFGLTRERIAAEMQFYSDFLKTLPL
jgi:hypothetical protein